MSKIINSRKNVRPSYTEADRFSHIAKCPHCHELICGHKSNSRLEALQALNSGWAVHAQSNIAYLDQWGSVHTVAGDTKHGEVKCRSYDEHFILHCAEPGNVSNPEEHYMNCRGHHVVVGVPCTSKHIHIGAWPRSWILQVDPHNTVEFTPCYLRINT